MIFQGYLYSNFDTCICIDADYRLIFLFMPKKNLFNILKMLPLDRFLYHMRSFALPRPIGIHDVFLSVAVDRIAYINQN